MEETTVLLKGFYIGGVYIEPTEIRALRGDSQLVQLLNSLLP